MRVLVWNCQGVGSPLTIPHLREVINLSSPNILFLCETKNRSKYMEKVKNILKFDEAVIVESMNRAGGMALFWKEEIKIKQVLRSAFTKKAQVEDRESRSEWWFIGVYASCDDQIRKQQWKVIQARKGLWGERWLLDGDFNDILSNEEKWGGNWREDRSFKDFKDFLNENQLMDIGFEGHPWTWCNNWESEGEIRQRIDRGLCNYPWYKMFEKVSCKHLDTYASNHSMLLIDTKPGKIKKKKRFFFDKRWLQKEGITEVVKQAWRQSDEGTRMFKLTQKIKRCRISLLRWKNKFQSNSKEHIERIKKNLQELRETEMQNKNNRMRFLKKSLKKAYREEEIFWSQKSRLSWLKERDKNTKFFHASIQGRRKRNTILDMQRDDGSWTRSEEELSAEIANYYKNLFKSTEGENLDEILEGIPQTITESMNNNLFSSL
ncbi:uncharacterized protein [Coffea arabica]|uniref:Endonuclease/exonuclease/phosphatase domain-containing protein n=1 Tax=Coffea arabica TaxID=13443 RepID=A0ABM4UEN8_COFAR